MVNNISFYIKARIPLTEISTQAMTDIDLVGTWIASEISYMYVNRSLQNSIPTLSKMMDEVDGTPFANSSYISYDIIDGLSQALDYHQPLAITFLAGPPIKPQGTSYVHPPLSSYAIIKSTVQTQLLSKLGTSTLTPTFDLFLLALDDFMTATYLSP